MKNIFKMIAIAMMMATAFSCQKAETPEMETEKDTTMTFTADFLGTKTNFNEGKLTWEAGDQIAVCDGTTVETVTLTSDDIKSEGASAEIKTTDLATDAAQYYAVFPAACTYNLVDNIVFDSFIYHDCIHISRSVAVDKSLTFKSYAVASEAGGHFMFKNVDAIVYFKTERTDIAYVEFRSNVSGDVRGDIFINPTTGAITHSEKRLYEETEKILYSLDGDKEAYIPVNAGITLVGGYTLTAYNFDDNAIGTISTSSDLTFENGKYYSIKDFDSRLIPAGTIPHKFSVSDTKQVYFSQGNLYYDGSDFLFEDNQYDFHGYSPEDNTMGLFGWSTAASNYGMSTSISNKDYSGDFEDWGKNIGDGRWRTLAKDEWQYLFEIRTDASNLFRTGVTVCSVENCLIIAPDDFAETIADSYNASTWSEAEAAGLVCLPVAGFRRGSTLFDVGNIGYYWSSSAFDESGAYFENISGHVESGLFNQRSCGFSVRLVTDVK